MAGFWYPATISFQTEVSAWGFPWFELGLLLFINSRFTHYGHNQFIDREIRDIEGVSFQTGFYFSLPQNKPEEVRALWGVHPTRSFWTAVRIPPDVFGRGEPRRFKDAVKRVRDAMFGALDDSQLDTAFDDSRGDGVAGETRGVVDVELLHEILAVFFHRFDADAKFRRGFFINVAFSNQLKHLCLA